MKTLELFLIGTLSYTSCSKKLNETLPIGDQGEQHQTSEPNTTVPQPKTNEIPTILADLVYQTASLSKNLDDETVFHIRIANKSFDPYDKNEIKKISIYMRRNSVLESDSKISFEQIDRDQRSSIDFSIEEDYKIKKMWSLFNEGSSCELSSESAEGNESGARVFQGTLICKNLTEAFDPKQSETLSFNMKIKTAVYDLTGYNH